MRDFFFFFFTEFDQTGFLIIHHAAIVYFPLGTLTLFSSALDRGGVVVHEAASGRLDGAQDVGTLEIYLDRVSAKESSQAVEQEGVKVAGVDGPGKKKRGMFSMTRTGRIFVIQKRALHFPASQR